MVSTDSPPQFEDPVRKLNPAYRWTRQVSDRTRRSSRLGRDLMLDRIADRPAGSVLEIGCGTACNLHVLAEKAPQHALYGIDASLAKLATARDRLERAGCHDRIGLGYGRAPALNPKRQLGVEGPFDVVFFSCVLSRQSAGPEALEAGLSHLAPDGHLYFVDDWPPTSLFSTVAASLNWLGLVTDAPRSDLLDRLRRLDAEGRVSYTVTPVVEREAYLATVAPRSSAPSPSEARDAQAARPTGPGDELRRPASKGPIPA